MYSLEFVQTKAYLSPLVVWIPTGSSPTKSLSRGVFITSVSSISSGDDTFLQNSIPAVT